MKCSRDECPGTGVWGPILVLRAGVKGRPFTATLKDVVVCEQHKSEATLKDFLSDEGWDRIVRHLRESGKEAPSRSLTELKFERSQPE